MGEEEEAAVVPQEILGELGVLGEWVAKVEARLLALEGAAHSSHSLDEGAVMVLTNLIMQRINDSLRKHLGRPER